MHPPYDVSTDHIRDALEHLRTDSFLVERFESHNPAFGYNTWEGYIEESCVRALDQTISERLGIARSAWVRWTSDDEGMHVLAAVLHPLLTERNRTAIPFDLWFADQVQSGALRSGQIEAQYRELSRRHAGARNCNVT